MNGIIGYGYLPLKEDEKRMKECICCPRRCQVDRALQTGYCGAAALPRVARCALHFWEEPMFSGSRGSGTIFFSGCNLRCVFCQNAEISAHQKGELCDKVRLSELFLTLQKEGAHNINLVTPTPHLETIRTALIEAKAHGLHIPVLYNTGGYETVEALRSMDGLIDIYLPDLKYVTPALSDRFSGAANYFEYAAPAILEMQRQVGTLRMDGDGISTGGLLVRHLMLPGCVDETRRVLDFIKDSLPCGTWISLMRQYTPSPGLTPPLDRRLTSREYMRAAEYCMQLGLANVLLQEADAADSAFTPPFYQSLTPCS